MSSYRQNFADPDPIFAYDLAEPGARALLDFCGLPWDERCLDFHRTERPVRTASHAQVRQPLYRNAIGSADPYRAHLGPLIEAMRKHLYFAAGATYQSRHVRLHPNYWQNLPSALRGPGRDGYLTLRRSPAPPSGAGSYPVI